MRASNPSAAVALQVQLLAHENALVALIVALDRSGALPIAAAKAALDAMAGTLPEGPTNEPQREVFRRLSAHLAREAAPRPPRGRQH